MCLAVPMRVVQINGNKAVVESHGVETLVDITLYPDLHVDDMVIIHAGFVIEKLDPQAAREIESTWEEYVRVMEKS
jgi:hydrogenase expression/formation protein HypC